MRESRSLSLAAGLVAVWTAFALASDAFLGARNLSMLAIEVSITAVLALGMLVVLLLGQIDLSAGSAVGLTGGVASVLVFHHGWPAVPAMLFACVCTIAIATVQGTLVVKARLPAFIVTLGGLLVLKGLFWLVIKNATVPVANNVFAQLTTYFLPRGAGIALFLIAYVGWLVQRRRQKDREVSVLQAFVIGQTLLLLWLVLDRFRGVPLTLVVLGVVAAFIHTLTQRLRFGRHLYASGDNPEAARLSGVNVPRVTITAFAIMGAVSATTGLLQTAYAGAATTTVGDLMELDAIAACVMGGTSLRGGRGSVAGVLFGALLMASLLNGMTLLAVSPELKLIARGTVLVLAVWLDVARQP